MANIQIEIDRCDRVYRQNDKVSGKVIIQNQKSNLRHGGITLTSWGTVKLSVRRRRRS